MNTGSGSLRCLAGDVLIADPCFTVRGRTGIRSHTGSGTSGFKSETRLLASHCPAGPHPQSHPWPHNDLQKTLFFPLFGISLLLEDVQEEMIQGLE